MLVSDVSAKRFAELPELMTAIAIATGEQASGIDDVNRAVMHMEQTTQQNAALVEESAAAARTLEEQTNVLAGLIRFFKTAAKAA